MLIRWVLSRDRKTATEGAEVTRSGRLFQTRAAATGKARSPTVDSRVRLTISDEDELERSRRRRHRQTSRKSSVDCGRLWPSLFFSHNLYCFFISVYFMLLLAVLVTIGPSAFNKFGLIWFGFCFGWGTTPVFAFTPFSLFSSSSERLGGGGP